MTEHSIELDSGSSLDALKERKISFLVIYANWCGHCHVFLPIYEKVAHKLKDANFYKIDGSENPERAIALAEGNWEQYFPSIHTFVNGKHIENYTGSRDDANFTKYCMDIITNHQ